MEIYLSIFLSGFCAVTLIAFGYYAFNAIKAMRNQITLSLKSQHLSVRELRSMNYKVDRISSTAQETLDEQRKSFEHQRVLMSSLNRQLKTLDSMALSSQRKNTPATKTSAQKTQVEPKKATPVPEAQSQASLLTQLFQSENGASKFKEAGSQKIQRLSDLFANGNIGQSDAVNVEERRVSNG